MKNLHYALSLAAIIICSQASIAQQYRTGLNLDPKSSAGLAIYDTMQYIKNDVRTIVMGQACSMGSFLAMAGTAGKRVVLPESRTMIHRVSSGTRGTSGSVYVQELEFEDARRSMEESKKVNTRLTELYVKHNTANKTYEQMAETMKFDTFLTAQEAVEWGLADKVVDKR